ncbi:methylation-associated defense system restriction endonuclease subunit S MAD5 [Micromonospora yangpuensis]|uniref:Type I restriction enzyme, S subunit n=1 Tax=Micromonospora yangpuensis TaxID=683228 RepID=A0A1C6U9C9_9ACTN|nr:hypothetical protein [Micromonospora yangpuensis]GGL88335.1 type I restriction-modification system restriction endonuclease DNA specificity subunit HsdS [Micromonospora yangpuensis]SCL50705.1 type I restriction enzyme, S subunit [Micromonospora yangpuensis]
MKLASPDNPVQASWLAEQGFRLDPGPYVSDAYAARKYLDRMPHSDLLHAITARIFHAGRVTREWTTDPAHGVPFLGSADIFEADLSNLPMITKRSFKENPKLPLEPGWTLVTRSGMTAGRVTYARLSMAGAACSEHVMRVVPDLARIPAGYLYTFLASPFGIPVIKGGIYGTSVRHIEPSHVTELPVPRFGGGVEERIDALITEAMQLRQHYEDGVREATRYLFVSAGIPELLDLRWHDRERDLGFTIERPTALSLRALNYSPRARRIIDALRSVPHRPLGDICTGGSLRTGARFKRYDSDSLHGVRLVGQRQAFWLRPSGRWINPKLAPDDIHMTDETVLIAAHGTLGEREVFGRSLLATGRALSNAYSQDFVRVVSGQEDAPGAYLFAFFRTDAAFRILRSMSVGGKQQEYHPSLLRDLPVPMAAAADRERIAGVVRQAYRDRDDADRKEDEAFALLDKAVREAAR